MYLPTEQEDAEETKSLVESAGRKCKLIPFDLERLRDLHEIVDTHMKEYGRLDILVNNASKQVMCKNYEDIEIDSIESTFRSNILQMMALTKFAVPHIPKGGSIINTTSVVAFRGTSSMVDYAATKGAIVGFTRALSKSLTKKGIRVNAVAYILPYHHSSPSLPLTRPQARPRTHTPPACQPSCRTDGGFWYSESDRTCRTALRDRHQFRLPGVKGCVALLWPDTPRLPHG